TRLPWPLKYSWAVRLACAPVERWMKPSFRSMPGEHAAVFGGLAQVRGNDFVARRHAGRPKPNSAMLVSSQDDTPVARANSSGLPEPAADPARPRSVATR